MSVTYATSSPEYVLLPGVKPLREQTLPSTEKWTLSGHSRAGEATAFFVQNLNWQLGIQFCFC